MYGDYQQHLQAELDGIREAGFYKTERVITTPQGSHVHVTSGEVLLGNAAGDVPPIKFSDDPKVNAPNPDIPGQTRQTLTTFRRPRPLRAKSISE